MSKASKKPKQQPKGLLGFGFVEALRVKMHNAMPLINAVIFWSILVFGAIILLAIWWMYKGSH